MKKTTFLLLALLFLILQPSLSAQGTHRAALVVQTAAGTVITQCVPFTEDSISGYELLVRSGLPLIVDAGGMGTAVCSINDTGCPSSNCFCACSGSECVYWSYWHRMSDVWVYSTGGASVSMIADGAVDGWVWGPGSVTDAVPPPAYSFDSICNAPATVTPSPTATPVTPESTPITISTPLPTNIAPTSTAVPTTATAVPPTSTPAPTATETAPIFTTPTAAPTARPENDDGADNGSGTAVDAPTTVPVLPTHTPQPSSPLSPPDSDGESLMPSPTAVTPPTPTPPIIEKTEPITAVNEITAVSEITAVNNPTPITVIGAGETGQNGSTDAEPAQNSIGEIAPYAFFLLMIGGLVGGRFWLSRKKGG